MFPAIVLLFVGLSQAAAASQSVATPASAAAPASVNVWQGRTNEYEEALRTAQVTKIVDLSVGVTHPQHVFVEPGGLIESFAWKTIMPGRYNGFWESYKSEVAAYELDKLIGLNMVPVVVERKVKGAKGAAVLWLNNVRSWEATIPLPKPPSWAREVVRMKMFDELIGNDDRNKGNMIVDLAWNLYLIDHTRAFIGDKRLPGVPLEHVDQELWQSMLALNSETLTQTLIPWIDKGSIRALLDRRDAMKKVIDALVAKQGDAAYIMF